MSQKTKELIVALIGYFVLFGVMYYLVISFLDTVKDLK